MMPLAKRATGGAEKKCQRRLCWMFGLGVRGRWFAKQTEDVFCWKVLSIKKYTLLEINISHLRKRKIIFKIALLGGYVSSLEGILYLHELSKYLPNHK